MADMPNQRLQRSFVYRNLEQAGAKFSEVAGSLMAISVPDGTVDVAQNLGVADLSLLPRTGYKGAEALDWLGNQGIYIGVESNKAIEQTDGSICAKLAASEALILSPLAGFSNVVSDLKAAWAKGTDQRAYEVQREDVNFEFIITGESSAHMFAKICGVNLSPSHFAPFDVTQTSVARSNCILIRCDVGSTLAFRMLGDSASAEYMLECLLDAMAEFGGSIVGHDALTALSAI
jgi:sarcosine oxidase subunit gamma